jgi:hypothetical protein
MSHAFDAAINSQAQDSKFVHRSDDEVSSLEQTRRLADSNAERNASSPFCRLPPEVLGRILSFAQSPLATSAEQMSEPEWTDYNPKWMECINVCRRVRAVALETPRLWSTIPYDPYREPGAFTHLCLSRPQPCKLDVLIHKTRRQSSFFDMPAMSTHVFSRTRRLCLTAEYSRVSYKIQEACEHVLAQYIPHIEELHCAVRGLRLPPMFLGDTSTTLVRLVLDQVNLGEGTSVAAFDLPSLSYLSLGTEDYDDTERLSSLLRGTPNIRVCKLKLKRPRSAAIVHRPQNRTHLPRLHTLSIVSNSHVNVAMMTSIVPPPFSRLYIDTGTLAFEPASDPSIHSYIHEFWRRAAGHTPLPSAWICHNSKSGCAMTIGSRFDVDAAADTRSTRLFCQYPYGPPLDGRCTLRPEMLALADTVHFASAGSPCRHANEDDLGSQTRHVIVEQAETLLPPSLDQWMRRRGWERHSLETVKFIQSPGVWEHVGRLKDLGVIREVSWDSETGPSTARLDEEAAESVE